jgi:hypothetical protein
MEGPRRATFAGRAEGEGKNSDEIARADPCHETPPPSPLVARPAPAPSPPGRAGAEGEGPMNSRKGADALDRRPQRSYHEAAHAVVARKLGQSCIGIMMFPTDPQSNACALTGLAAYHSGGTVDERIEGLKCDARISLAGPIANVLYSGCEKRLYDGTGGDFEHARSDAASIALLMAGHPLPQHHNDLQIDVDVAVLEQANSILSAIMAETKSLVSENWSAIERVANVLLTADLMTEVELDRLIADPKVQSSSG